MIPLRDENPSRTTPWMTYTLVALNVGTYLYQLSIQTRVPQETYIAFLHNVALVPRYLFEPSLWGQTLVPVPLTIFTAMFLHGGLFHLLGNMLYMWVFADNVEDAMGSLRFLAFYLACGVGAAAAQVVVSPESTIPMVGASGAIAGVLGAYLLLYPRAQVLTLVFLFFFVRIMYLPSVLLLGLWFLIQVMSAAGGGGAGVAWYAHIGGFAVGALTLGLFTAGRRRQPDFDVL